MRNDQAKDILLRIAAIYPRFDLMDPPKRLEIWMEQLIKMPYEPVRQRLTDHLLSNPFPPSIAEIAVKEPPRNEFLAKQRQWEDEVRAESAQKH